MSIKIVSRSAATTATVVHEAPVNPRWPEFAGGAKGDNSTDDLAALNAAIAHVRTARAGGQRGATLLLDGGSYRTSNEIVIPGTDVTVLGDGVESTVIRPLTDFGAGKFAIRGDALKGRHLTFEKFRVVGPTASSPPTGASSAAMSGVQLPGGGCISRDVTAEYFHSGIELSADHSALYDCIASSNFYGVYFGLDVNQEADQRIIGCELANNSLASIGIRGSNVMGGVTIIGTHMGYSPYGIYKEDSTAFPQTVGDVTYTQEPHAVSGCVFIDSPCEAYSHGFIYCENGVDYVIGNTFIDVATSNPFASEFDLPGDVPKRASVTCGRFEQNHGMGALESLLTPGPAADGCSILTDQISTANLFELRAWAGQTKPLITLTLPGAARTRVRLADGREGRLVRLHAGAVSANDLIAAASSLDRMQRYPAGGTMPAQGVAAQPCSIIGDHFLMWERGEAVDIASTDATVLGHDVWLKPSGADAGKVVAAANRADGAVAFSRAGLAEGTKIDVSLRL